MKENEQIKWLLEGDVSIQYQVHRDLLDSEQPRLRERISRQVWGAQFLAARGHNGHWGRSYYQPKWISTHYTLLDLRNLDISPDIEAINETLSMIFREEKGSDGGINPHVAVVASDVCVSGMVLNYAAYFGVSEHDLRSVVDFILTQRMGDGGFNCFSNTAGAVHSSLHTTISTIEGILEYKRNGYRYRLNELLAAEEDAREFILQHRLFKSDKTGKIIKKSMTMLSYPSRWKYDILRALDYFRLADVDYDSRMEDAISILMKKRKRDKTWPLQAKHPGKTHFDMEETGRSSRWNTLRALRVLKHFGQ
jgi:hypothetical protein